MKEKIGFIGLGTMGQGMCKNLLQAGYQLVVWNRTTEKAQAISTLGAHIAENPRQVANQTNIICICVSDTPDVEEVIFSTDGVLTAAKSGTLIIDFSTINPNTTKAIAEKLRIKGMQFIDAPVSGGSEGAQNGTLSIMAGGEPDQIQRAMPIFESVGKTITHIGPNGAGQMAKLVNQILVVINMLAVSEALLFAKAGDLDLETTLHAVEKGAAGSWMLSNRGIQAIHNYWQPGFTIDLQQKDLRLVLNTADELGIPLITTSMVFQLYKRLQHDGLGSEGNHALIKAVEQITGIKLNTD